MDFNCSELSWWKEALSSYKSQIKSLNKPNLISLDDFYTNELPLLITQRNPSPYITTSELSNLMQWKLTRGKWRPRLLEFVASLNDDVVKSASQKAFLALPDISKAVNELTVLKGVGPATASAVLAAFAPHIAPFMSDEAMEASIDNTKDYTLKNYVSFAKKLQDKAQLAGLKAREENYSRYANLWRIFRRICFTCGPAHNSELTSKGDPFTPSDVERALWSSSVAKKALSTKSNKAGPEKSCKRKRKG